MKLQRAIVGFLGLFTFCNCARALSKTLAWGSTTACTPWTLLLLIILPAVVQAQFTYTTNNGTITITQYTGPGGAVIIPDTIYGLPITGIGTNAFFDCLSLTSVTIGNGVTSIEDDAFRYCTSLTSVTIGSNVTSIAAFAFSSCWSLAAVCFEGNAPVQHTAVFYQDNQATVYYLPGTVGWGALFGDLETMLWNPQAQAAGVRTNGFGFNITGTTNIPIVVEASTNLQGASWTSLQSCTLTNGSIYFSDPQWTNYPTRFYRIRSP